MPSITDSFSAIYSAAVEESAADFCFFFVFHVMVQFPYNLKMKPVVLILVVASLAQLETCQDITVL